MNAKTQTANVMQLSPAIEHEAQPIAMVQHSTSTLVLDGDSMDKMSRFDEKALADFDADYNLA